MHVEYFLVELLQPQLLLVLIKNQLYNKFNEKTIFNKFQYTTTLAPGNLPS